jgi:hypothetical protein
MDQIFANIVAQLAPYAAQHMPNAATITTALGTGVTQVALGVFITAFAAMLREVLTPVRTSINTIGTNIQGQTTAIEAKADELLTHKSKIPKIKPDTPEAFDGKPDHVMSFLAALTVYYSALGEENNKNMILFALSRIKGGKENVASRWADAKMIEIVNYDSTIAKGKMANASTTDKNNVLAAIDPIGDWETFTK